MKNDILKGVGWGVLLSWLLAKMSETERECVWLRRRLYRAKISGHSGIAGAPLASTRVCKVVYIALYLSDSSCAMGSCSRSFAIL